MKLIKSYLMTDRTGIDVHSSVIDFNIKISPQSPWGGECECGPKNIKNFYFLVKSRPLTPSTDFENFGGFYTPNYLAWVIQIWRDSLHSLLSYCWETAHRSIRSNFSMHPVGKTMRWVKKWIWPYHHAKFGEDCTVGVKTWCLYVFLFVFLSRSEDGALFIRGVHSLNRHCIAVYRLISTRFSVLFQNG